MQRKSRCVSVALFLGLMISCSDDVSMATYTASMGNFSNTLTVEGYTEPLQSTTLICPRPPSGFIDGIVEYLAEEGTFVEEGQVVCTIDCQELRNNYEQMTMSLENAETGINKTKADLNMQFALLEAQVRTNDADTRIAQVDSLKMAYMSENEKKIKELELQRANIDKARYEKKLTALKVIQQSEIKRMELEIQQFKVRVEATKEAMEGLSIKAPQNGLFILARNGSTGEKYKIGDNLWSGRTFATLPDIKMMKVKIQVSESDFKSISVNDSIFYTFDAMPGNWGTGKVLMKSPVGQPYKWGSTVKVFDIDASLDSVQTMPDPGFTANCKIFLKHVENVVCVPQIAIFEADSMKVVYIQQKRGFEKRQVLTDFSSQREAIVTAGLKDGEVVSLSMPKTSQIKKTTVLPDSLLIKPEIKENVPKQEIRQGLPPGITPSMPPGVVRQI